MAEHRGLAVARFEPLALDRLLTSSLSLAELADEVFAPFDTLTPAERAQCLCPRNTCLEFDRSPTATTRRLHVHPRTARYRVGPDRGMLGHAVPDRVAGLAPQNTLRERLRA